MRKWDTMNWWQRYWHNHIWQLVSHEPEFIATSDKAPSNHYVRNMPCEGYFIYKVKCYKCGCEHNITPAEYNQTMDIYRT